MNRHQPIELRDDLVDHLGRAVRDDGDATDRMIMRDVRHRQAVDIISARGEQAGDASKDTRLVGDRQRQDVPLAIFFLYVH